MYKCDLIVPPSGQKLNLHQRCPSFRYSQAEAHLISLLKSVGLRLLIGWNENPQQPDKPLTNKPNFQLHFQPFYFSKKEKEILQHLFMCLRFAPNYNEKHQWEYWDQRQYSPNDTHSWSPTQFLYVLPPLHLVQKAGFVSLSHNSPKDCQKKRSFSFWAGLMSDLK